MADKDSTISIRVPADLKALAEQVARSESRTLANWIAWTIRKALKDAGHAIPD